MSVASPGDAPQGDSKKKRLDLSDSPLYETLSLNQKLHVVKFCKAWDNMHPTDQYNMAVELSIQVLAGQNAAADIMKQQFKGLDVPGLEGMG